MTQLGANAPVQGFTERAKQTALALQAGAFVWMPAEGPQDALWVNANIGPALHVVRLDTPRPGEQADDYTSRVADRVHEWWSVPNVAYCPGNEPTIDAGWSLGAWLAAAHEYTLAMKVWFPGIRLTSVPLKVEETGSLTLDAVLNCDYCNVHSYIEAPHWDDIENEGLGASWKTALRFGAPIIVSEFGCVGGQDAPTIIRWVQEMDAGGVVAAMLFILDGVGTQWAALDVSIEMAAAIRAGTIPPPVPDPPPPPEPSPMNPYTYDGDYPYATFTRMVAGALSRKNPSVASRDNYRAVHAAAKQRNISVATLLGWIVAENVDPDLIAVNNLAGIYYVGQSRATPGPPGPANEGSKPYCAFATLTDFWVTLAINIMTIDPDAWNRGDLRSIARTYTGGAQGYAKVDIVDALRDAARFPHGTVEQTPSPHRYQIVTPVDCPVAQGSDGDFSHGGVTPGFFAIDYACARGTPCRAAADGTVGVIYTTDWNPVSARTGPSVWIDHDCGYSTFSCHLSRIDVASDDRVTQGQIIGLTGDPAIDGGFGSGAHLHWEIWDTARHVRVRMEDLEAAGIAGPWSDESPEEQIDMHVDGKFDDGRIKRLWDGPKTKTAIKAVGGYSDQRGIDARWLAELQAGKPVGFAVSNEENIPTGGKIRYFSNGFICSYPDGSTTVC
jgi:murein DD-endopeptidase MepM/ murein hydrolase activator NlpD